MRLQAWEGIAREESTDLAGVIEIHMQRAWRFVGGGGQGSGLQMGLYGGFPDWPQRFIGGPCHRRKRTRWWEPGRLSELLRSEASALKQCLGEFCFQVHRAS